MAGDNERARAIRAIVAAQWVQAIEIYRSRSSNLHIKSMCVLDFSPEVQRVFERFAALPTPEQLVDGDL